MAQIIKHRRGSIDSLKGAYANKGELVIATGSVGNMNGPWIFVGDNDANGAFKSTAKIYQGNAVPTIPSGTYGTTLDGVPFYSNDEVSLYILDGTGNQKIDLTGNIEGNTISGVTINNLQSTNVTASFVSASFVGDASGLYNIPATGVTGLNLSKIYSGSVQVSTDSDSGTITLSGGTVNVNNDLYVNSSTLYVNQIAGNDSYGLVNIYTEDYAQLNYSDTNYIWVQSNGAWIETNGSDITLEAYSGNVNLYADTNINLQGSDIYISGSNTSKIGQLDNTAYFYTSQNYAEMNSSNGLDVVANGGTLWVYNNSGNVQISSYDGSTLYLNTDGGEGDVHIGNSANSLYSHLVNVEISGSIYAELHSGNEYVWAEAGQGAFLESDTNGISGFSARINGIAEVTGSFNIYGDTQIDGNTSITGALVVSNGSATFDQGLVAENSNLLLTSGSNLVIENGGNANIAGNVYVTGSEYVDYIYGYTTNGNYIAFNYGAVGGGDVEVASVGNISLWAEGGLGPVPGNINVTGSMIVTNDITASNMHLTGDLRLDGNIVIGGTTGDTINLTGEISSSIIPSGSGLFDLGSSTNLWNNIWAETAHFTNISLDTISFTGLTEGRVLLAGPDGSIVDSGSLTYDGSSLNITGSTNVENAITASVIWATQNALGENFKVGDDAWIGDINVANTMQVKGQEDSTQGFIQLGTTGYTNTIGSEGVNLNLYSDNNINISGSNNVNIMGSNYVGVGQTDASGYFYSEANYAEVFGSNEIELYSDTEVLIYANSGNVNIYSYDGGNLNLNNDGGEGDIFALNGSNNLHVNGNQSISGSIYQTASQTINSDKIVGVSNTLNIIDLNDIVLGDLGLFSNNNVKVSGSNVNISGSNSTTIGQLDETAYFYTSNNYAKMYGNTSLDVYTNSGNLWVYNDNGTVNISSYNGALNLNTDGDEGDVYILNGSNALHVDGQTTISGNVLPGADIQYDLGSSSYRWNNIYANTAHFDTINLNTIAFSGLTEGRVVLVGPNGSLVDSGSFYYDNGTLINSGSVELSEGSDLHVTSINSYYDNGSDLNIDAANHLYLYSDNQYVEMSAYNNENGTNYIWIEGDGLGLQTYDYTSDLYHTVYLDNTGSLKLTNVDLLISGSLGVNGNSIFNNDLTVDGNMYVSGNFSVLGTGSVIHLTSSQVDIGTNVINLNTYAPFERFAGISVYDSGSNAGVTGSLLWDSLNNVWIYANPSGSAYASARIISGPQNTGSIGQETGLTNGHIPVATGDDHISDSPLTYIGTTLALNTNKFTVDSTSGDTVIQGNFTIHGVGATDNGEATSYVVFKNSDDQLGFVNISDTQTESDALLGYNTSTGVLQFSSLIDGGTY